jgi:hypothetical protein
MMNFRNPTALELGMAGTLQGVNYRVVGRVVMGMEEEGETYFWNEYNLETTDQEEATLVFEETEQGAQWRLFRYFEPECELTAADAATKQVGDSLNLDGTDVRVTLVDESRVFHIEGRAPEGVEVGDVARYFNAEADGVMVVVSWTREEVECYHGEDLSSTVVSTAFNLPPQFSRFVPSMLKATGSGTSPNAIKRIVSTVLVVLAILGGYVAFKSKRTSAGPRRTDAPGAVVRLGSMGNLAGKEFHVVSESLVDVAEVGRIFTCREYAMTSNRGEETFLLIGGLGGGGEWRLFVPIFLSQPLNPVQAAKLQVGQSVNFDGQRAIVSELFLSTVRQTEPTDKTQIVVGNRWYGFRTRSGPNAFLVRWNDHEITVYRETTVSASEIAKAFTPR